MDEKVKKTRFKKIVSYLAKGLLVLLFSYIFFYASFNLVAPDLTVKSLGYKAYSIVTGSMEPEIMIGDMVIVVKKDFYKLEEGDIVTFKDPMGNVVTHRFVRYEHNTYFNQAGYQVTETIIKTKPDAPNPITGVYIEEDPWSINEFDYIGLYKSKISNLGNIVMFLQSWIGIVVIVISMALIYFIIYLFGKIKEDKKAELIKDNSADRAEDIPQLLPEEPSPPEDNKDQEPKKE